MKKLFLFLAAVVWTVVMNAQALAPISWTAYGLTFDAPRGILVEEAEASSLYKNAVHPYTKLLFEGIKDSNIEVKSTLQQENFCCFAHRCPYADEKCKNSIPQMREIAENHKVRCFHI